MIYKNVGDSIFFINIKSYYFYVIEYLLKSSGEYLHEYSDSKNSD